MATAHASHTHQQTGAQAPSGGPRSHAHGMTGARLRTAFLLTVVILLVELVGGLISHSLALLSDAGHVLTDIIALGLAWFALVRA